MGDADLARVMRTQIEAGRRVLNILRVFLVRSQSSLQPPPPCVSVTHLVLAVVGAGR